MAHAREQVQLMQTELRQQVQRMQAEVHDQVLLHMIKWNKPCSGKYNKEFDKEYNKCYAIRSAKVWCCCACAVHFQGALMRQVPSIYPLFMPFPSAGGLLHGTLAQPRPVAPP